MFEFDAPIFSGIPGGTHENRIRSQFSRGNLGHDSHGFPRIFFFDCKQQAAKLGRSPKLSSRPTSIRLRAENAEAGLHALFNGAPFQLKQDSVLDDNVGKYCPIFF